MPRHPPRNLDFMGPSAICDTCGAPGWDCHSPGLVCWHCRAGLFMQRKFWDYSQCPDCGPGNRAICPYCKAAGVIAAPRVEVTEEEVQLEYAALVERYRSRRYPLPEQLIVRLQATHEALTEAR